MIFVKVLDFLKNNKLVQFVLVLLVGITIGAVFYPTKHIEETLTSKYESEIKTLKETHSKELQTEHDKLTKTSEEFSSYKSESSKKISSLTTEVKTLQSKQKTAYYKVIRPDGTIEIKKFSESEVNESSQVVTQIQEEFKQKISSIENKWETIHKEKVASLQKDFDTKEQDYQRQISELKTTKIVDVNPKRFGLEGGMLTNKDYYGHATMDVWGPFFVGVHGQMGQGADTGLIGAGVGLRF